MNTTDSNLLKQMRDWVADCAPDSDSFDFAMEDMTDAQIERYVRRNFCGGIEGFTQTVSAN